MRRNFCPADVRGGVQLVKQRSDVPCIFNRTWGYVNGRGIWVDRGCRADFQLGGSGWGGWDQGYNIYCASDDGRRTICPTDTRGGVRVVRQVSGSPCDFGRTWGYDRRGIWVDRGCRADFQIGGRWRWRLATGRPRRASHQLLLRRYEAALLSHPYERWRSPDSPAPRRRLPVQPYLGLRPPRYLGRSRLPRRFRSRPTPLGETV
jgi:hypothetical protein